jgi:glutamate racemase
MQQQPSIDAIILGCTHYPIIEEKIKQYLPPHVKLLSQGAIVAKSLNDYLQRHVELETNCSKNKTIQFCTTDIPEVFDKAAGIFFDGVVNSKRIEL